MSTSSSSSDETEELVRSSPPPQRIATWPGPSAQPEPTLSPIYYTYENMYNAPSPQTVVIPCQIPPIVITTCPPCPSRRPQLDGHESSAEQKDRKQGKKRVKNAEPVPEVIFWHYCARCGRTRSKTFQREHPISPGKEPYPGICSRCILPSDPEPAIAETNNKVIEEETEELLIRRRGGDRLTSWFTPNTEEDIRIKRRQQAPIQLACRRRHASSSEGKAEDKTEECCNESRSRATTEPRIIRIRVRSRSRDDQFNDTRVRVRRYDDSVRESADSKMWSQPRVVRIVREPPQKALERIQPPEPRRPRRPPSPPEWYYRRVKCVRQSKDDHEAEISPGRSEDPGRGSPRSVRRLAAVTARRARLSPTPTSARPPLLDTHNPIRGVLQRSRHERLGRPHDLYGAEQEQYRRRRAVENSSSEEDYRDRRVRFAAGLTGQVNGDRQNANEAADDRRQEQRDQQDFKDTKKKVREGVHKGGGKYELYDVDGHFSEDGRSSGKHVKARHAASKTVYNNGDERSEGALSWLGLVGVIEG